MFNIPTIFEIIFNNTTTTGWTTPKALSESLSIVLYPNIRAYTDNSFYNKFYSGVSKGKTKIYENIAEEIAKTSFTTVIARMENKLASENFRSANFDAQKVADDMMSCIKNSSNLNGELIAGLVRSYHLNKPNRIYLFLAESLFYALKVQVVKNVEYEELKNLPQANILNTENQSAWTKLFSEDELEGQNLSARFIQILHL